MRSLIILTRLSVGGSVAPLSLPFPPPLDDSDAVRHCIESLLFSHVDTPREGGGGAGRESSLRIDCICPVSKGHSVISVACRMNIRSHGMSKASFCVKALLKQFQAGVGPLFLGAQY